MSVHCGFGWVQFPAIFRYVGGYDRDSSGHHADLEEEQLRGRCCDLGKEDSEGFRWSNGTKHRTETRSKRYAVHRRLAHGSSCVGPVNYGGAVAEHFLFTCLNILIIFT